MNTTSTVVQDWLNTAGMILVGIILFIGGFYFGGKNKEASLSKEQELADSISNFAIQVSSQNDEANVQDTIQPGKFVPNTNIFWIKVGQAPICPESHPIKGKFDTNVNVYYLTDYPQFDRVKPHICFSSEQFALEEAGFIRKF